MLMKRGGIKGHGGKCRHLLLGLASVLLLLVRCHAMASPAATNGSCASSSSSHATPGEGEEEDKATTSRIQDLMRAGLARYRESDYGEAVRLMGAAVQLRPRDPELLAYLGNSLFRDGRTDEAVGRFQQALQLEEDQGGQHHARYWSNLGSVLFEAKRYEEAMECYSRAQELEPADGTFQKNRETARLYLQTSSLVADLEGRSSHWNLSGSLRGYNYSHGLEATLALAVEQRPDLLPVAIEALRTAVMGERSMGQAFATAEHMLANALARLADLLPSDDEGRGVEGQQRAALLRDEAKKLLASSIELGREVAGVSGPALWRAGYWPGLGPYTKLHVVTVATAPRHELTNLNHSCEVLGWDLVVLGMNSTWQGLGSKVRLLQEYLARPGVRADDVVMFVDAYDVLLLPTAGLHLFERFERHFRHAAPIVMSGETGCAPDPSARLLYPYHTSRRPPLPYVNSGGYMGFVGAVRAMLAEVWSDIARHHALHGASPTQLDDQRWFTRYYLRQLGGAAGAPRMVSLDGEGLIFHTLHHVDPELLAVSSFGLRVNVTSAFTNGSTPCVLHGNGDGLQPFHALSDKLRRHGWPPHAFLAATTSGLPQRHRHAPGGAAAAAAHKSQTTTRRRRADSQDRRSASEPPPGLAV